MRNVHKKFQNPSIHCSKVNTHTHTDRQTHTHTDRQAESNMPFKPFQSWGHKNWESELRHLLDVQGFLITYSVNKASLPYTCNPPMNRKQSITVPPYHITTIRIENKACTVPPYHTENRKQRICSDSDFLPCKASGFLSSGLQIRRLHFP